MCRLARLLSPNRTSLHRETDPEPLCEEEELSLIFARLPPDDRAVLLQLGRKLAEAP